MSMTFIQQIITVLMVAIGTIITRFFSFIVFPAKRKAPKFIQYLGKALPASIFGLLVVYSLKDVNIFSKSTLLPTLISILLVIVLHIWKKQMFLSISAGTICYMILTQLIF